MNLYTRAEARDLIRHFLNKRTSVDENGETVGVVGNPASSHPWPSNTQLNEQMAEAIKHVNRKCSLGHVQDLSVSLAATTANGPQPLSLMTLQAIEGLGVGNLNTVKRVWWDDGTQTRRLWPLNRPEFDRAESVHAWGDEEFFRRGTASAPLSEWQSASPGVPEWFWLEGPNLYLYPGAASAGTLHLMCGTGGAALGFRCDADTIGVLPDDYHSAVWNLAAAYLAMTQVDDAEMLQVKTDRFALAQDNLNDILDWKRERNKGAQRTLAVRSNRPQPVYRRAR